MIGRARIRFLRLTAALGAMLALAGCGGPVVGQSFVAGGAPDRALNVALLPFENLSSDPNAGQIVAQLFASELYARGIFRLMEETEARKRANDAKLNLALLGEKFSAAEAARALGVEALLYGSVAEYRYQHGLKEEPSIGFSVRLVSRDGVVLWASSRAAVGGGVLQRASLTGLAQDLVTIMVRSLDGSSQ